MFTPTLPNLLFLLQYLFVLVLSSVAPPADRNATPPECSCYQATGNSGALFTYHQFYDFRNLNESVASNFSPPALITAAQDRGIEPQTSSFFDKSVFGTYFSPGNWIKNASETAPTRMVNSQQNVYLARDSANSPIHLTLRTNRLPTFQSASDLTSVETKFLHASFRVRARVSGSSGAVAGMFTYYNDSQESDIEILTRDDHGIMRATNQPGVDPDGKVIPEASTQVNLSATGSEGIVSWTEWNEYQLNWLPGQSEWLVNGLSRLNKTYGVPTVPSSFQIKMWSDGSSWPGNMSVGGLATLDIEWIDMVYNLSDQPFGGNYKTICNIDNISNDPNPVPMSGSHGGLSVGITTSMALWTFWVMVLNL